MNGRTKYSWARKTFAIGFCVCPNGQEGDAMAEIVAIIIDITREQKKTTALIIAGLICFAIGVVLGNPAAPETQFLIGIGFLFGSVLLTLIGYLISMVE